MHSRWWYLSTQVPEHTVITGLPTSNRGWRKNFFLHPGAGWSHFLGSRLLNVYSQTPIYGENRVEKVILGYPNFSLSFFLDQSNLHCFYSVVRASLVRGLTLPDKPSLFASCSRLLHVDEFGVSLRVHVRLGDPFVWALSRSDTQFLSFTRRHVGWSSV